MSTKTKPFPSVWEKQIRSWGEGRCWLGREGFSFLKKRNPEWRSASTPSKGIARTKRRAPAVRSIFKQTPSPVRGLSLGLWEWEWDWTVQACWKYSRSPICFFPECSRLDLGTLHGGKNPVPFRWSYLWATFPAYTEVNIFGWSRSVWGMSMTLSQHCMEDLRACVDLIVFSVSSSEEAMEENVHFTQIINEHHGHRFSLFSPYVSSGRLTLFPPPPPPLTRCWRTLVQCGVVRRDSTNNLPWETNNILAPECLLSVMRP